MKRENKQHLIYYELRKKIFKQEFKLDEPISERSLCEQFNVSRTPVREALKRLEYEGLIDIMPQKGAFVKELSIDAILRIYEIRLGLDPVAAHLCAVRATKDILDELDLYHKRYVAADKENNFEKAASYNIRFHETIAKGSNNNILYELEKNYISQCEKYIQMNIIEPASQKRSLNFHTLILDSIKNGNSLDAESYSRQHIESALSFMIEVHKRYYSY